MVLVLANKCTWLKVYSAQFYFMVYHISKVCLALMYMQHSHMVYGWLNKHHYLFLDKNSSDNDYPSPLRHEVWNVDHKMVILVMDFCYNKFSYLCVKRNNYLEHYSVCLSIFFHCIFFVFALINDTINAMIFFQMLLKFLS